MVLEFIQVPSACGGGHHKPGYMGKTCDNRSMVSFRIIARIRLGSGTSLGLTGFDPYPARKNTIDYLA
jgi:hypothetical protein